MMLFISLSLVVLATASSETVVHTDGGDVRGDTDGNCVRFFGIPYAAPPVGKHRFQPPQPPRPWSGIRDAANDIHSKCLQNNDAGALNEVTNGLLGREWTQKFLNLVLGVDGDEDCLFINVQTPNVQPAKLLPVMFYIHGGTNLIGTGSGYNASSLCRRDVVFVSINYRLGVLGNAAFSGALAESGTTGNYGLQDQRMAMMWVQRNIRNFGGDPNAVTISGESAGAMAVAAHIGLARSRSFFARGIMMSGNDDSLPLSEALAAGMKFAARVGCHDSDERTANATTRLMDCLRNKSASSLVNAQLVVYNESMRALQVPVADGFELPLGGSLRELFASGHVEAKPLLAGTNVNDSSMFFALTPREIFRGIVKQDLRHSIDRFLQGANETDRDTVHSLYSPKKFGGVRLALYALGTDGYFECPTRRMLLSMSARTASVYHYIYAAIPSSPAGSLGLPRWLDNFFRHTPPLKWLGVYHGSNEVVFWGAEDPTTLLTDDERRLGVRMVESWTRFVHGQHPWDPYSSNETYIRLDSHGDTEGHWWHSTECNELQEFRFIWNPVMTVNEFEGGVLSRSDSNDVVYVNV